MRTHTIWKKRISQMNTINIRITMKQTKQSINRITFTSIPTSFQSDAPMLSAPMTLFSGCRIAWCSLNKNIAVDSCKQQKQF